MKDEATWLWIRNFLIRKGEGGRGGKGDHPAPRFRADTFLTVAQVAFPFKLCSYEEIPNARLFSQKFPVGTRHVLKSRRWCLRVQPAVIAVFKYGKIPGNC
jgi:hypothetical protein